MGKYRYKAIACGCVDWWTVVEQAAGGRLVFGIDVAKHDFVAAVLRKEQEVVVIIKWRHPEGTREVLERWAELSQEVTLEIALEPTGTYGDALIWQLQQGGHAGYRVSPTRVHDAAEVYDGVASLHEAKAASVIGRLHLAGLSERWESLSEERREWKASLSQWEDTKGREQPVRHRLEAQLSRH